METLKKQNSCCSKIPPPPHNFSKGPSLYNHQPSEALKFNRQPSKSEKK